MTKTVLLEIDGAIAIVTLNRPDKMNALNAEMWRDLAAAFGTIAAAQGLRCVLLRGAGGNFAAGADLAEFSTLRANAAQAEAYGKMMLATLYKIRDCTLPTIAWIEGNCLGAGLEIAVMCDLRVGAENSKYGAPIQKIGVTMPYPELAAMVGVMGRAAVLEMLLEGGVYPADWALRVGLLTRIAPADQLESTVRTLTARVIAGSPLSHRNHKAFTLRCLDPQPLSAAELRQGYLACDSADYREGIRAFLEKRKPKFTGD
jgi:enoyl-CoA hydratase/carnithine racemase